MKIIKKNLKWITIIFVMIMIIGGVIIKYSLSNKKVEEISLEELGVEIQEENEISDEPPKTEEVEVIEFVYVDIKGAVKNPGVYEVSEDKKVIDIVNLAGGFTNVADTSMINLAKKVSDEMVIIIYTKEEVKNATEVETVVKIIEKECTCPEIKNDACINQDANVTLDETQKDEKININIATLEELLTLSGIGESKAKAIISYREENGRFEKVEDILQVSGIGESLYEKIKENITV